MASPTPDEVADIRRRRAEGASFAAIMADTGWGRSVVRRALTPATDAGTTRAHPANAKINTKSKAKTKARIAAKTTAAKTATIKTAASTPQSPRRQTEPSSSGERPVTTSQRSSRTAVPVKAGAGGKRRSLVDRLWRTADAQVREVERRLRDGEGEPGEREKDARTLAVVVKTLRDLLALEAERPPDTAKETSDDVRDLDDFRRELADRIDRLRRARDADPAAGQL